MMSSHVGDQGHLSHSQQRKELEVLPYHTSQNPRLLDTRQVARRLQLHLFGSERRPYNYLSL